MNRAELFASCTDLHERQCTAHGLDPADPMQQGVFRNLMQFVLDEWDERERAIGAATSGVVERVYEPAIELRRVKR